MEKYKLERKRERNRIAATKCRWVPGLGFLFFIMTFHLTYLRALTQSIKLWRALCRNFISDNCSRGGGRSTPQYQELSLSSLWETFLKDLSLILKLSLYMILHSYTATTLHVAKFSTTNHMHVVCPSIKCQRGAILIDKDSKGNF